MLSSIFKIYVVHSDDSVLSDMTEGKKTGQLHYKQEMSHQKLNLKFLLVIDDDNDFLTNYIM